MVTIATALSSPSLRFVWKERVEYRVRLGLYALWGVSSPLAPGTDKPNDRSFHQREQTLRIRRRHFRPNTWSERERASGRERERKRCSTHTYIYMCIYTRACNLENGGDSFMSDGRTYRPGTKETRGASMASSTPSISLIRLGTRFECSLSLSTTSSLSKNVRTRAHLCGTFVHVWHTWVAITRVPFEGTRELVVGSELA